MRVTLTFEVPPSADGREAKSVVFDFLQAVEQTAERAVRKVFEERDAAERARNQRYFEALCEACGLQPGSPMPTIKTTSPVKRRVHCLDLIGSLLEEGKLLDAATVLIHLDAVQRRLNGEQPSTAAMLLEAGRLADDSQIGFNFNGHLAGVNAW